jgi:hypothetical protein
LFKTKLIPGQHVKELLTKWEQEYQVFQGDSTKSISWQLRKARKALHQCRQNRSKLCIAYMERIAIKYEIEYEPKRAQIVKSIINAEEQAKMYGMLRSYLKPQSTIS